MIGWSGPKGQQDKTKNLLSVTGSFNVIVYSQKDNKGMSLKEHILKEFAPHDFDFDTRNAENLEELHQ